MFSSVYEYAYRSTVERISFVLCTSGYSWSDEAKDDRTSQLPFSIPNYVLYSLHYEYSALITCVVDVQQKNISKLLELLRLKRIVLKWLELGHTYIGLTWQLLPIVLFIKSFKTSSREKYMKQQNKPYMCEKLQTIKESLN